ncbi:hypothetical protein TWF694_001898 [Orbilia ellipsospora]|uniref:Uncharacterized protein n=1 Tax=Orbilia ellipsospora TaxID=2528407 RepID=A0AAV9X5C3_9PEZI
MASQAQARFEQKLQNLQDHLGNVLYEPERAYKRIVAVSIRFKSKSGPGLHERSCQALKTTMKRYVRFPNAFIFIDIIVEGDNPLVLKHPSGLDATILVREEIENQVFHQLFEQLSDHDPKLLICQIIGRGATLTDPQDDQMIPKTLKHQFFAICSEEPQPVFVNYKHLFEDVLIDPKASQFENKHHCRLMQATDVVLLLDCHYRGNPFETKPARNRTVEIICGKSNAHLFTNRFCKAFQNIVRLGYIGAEPSAVYEMMAYGKSSPPNFHRVIGSAPIILPMMPQDKRVVSDKVLKYLEEDFDSYETSQIFFPMELSYFGVSTDLLITAFRDWVGVLKTLFETKLSFIIRDKTYATHEIEIERRDKAIGKRLHTIVILVPFRYKTRFLELDGSCNITVKQIDQEARSERVRLCHRLGGATTYMEVQLGDWLDGLEAKLRKENEETAAGKMELIEGIGYEAFRDIGKPMPPRKLHGTT